MNLQLSDGEWLDNTVAEAFEPHTSVACIRVANISFGNTYIVADSTYIELECYNVVELLNMPPSSN